MQNELQAPARATGIQVAPTNGQGLQNAMADGGQQYASTLVNVGGPAVTNAVEQSGPGRIEKANLEGVVIDGIGDMSKEWTPATEEQEEGTGPHMVVLSNYLTGAGGKPFHQGQVVRVSRLINNYGHKGDLYDKNIDRTYTEVEVLAQVKADAKRLLENQAIRQAAPFETKYAVINVTQATETPEMGAIRAQMSAYEKENLKLKMQLAQMAQAKASPIPAGQTTIPGQQGQVATDVEMPEFK